jgi:hypothetical protein
MLAEKFFLVLETLRSHASDDGSKIVTSPERRVAIPESAAGSHEEGRSPTTDTANGPA